MRAALRQKRGHRIRTSKVRRSKNGIKSVHLTAPVHFSILENSDESIRFVNQITYEKNSNLILDLESIERLSPDAIIALISAISFVDMKVVGTGIKNQEMQEMLEASGFYDYVKSDRSNSTGKYGSIRHCQSEVVESNTANELVQFATKKLYDRPRNLPGCYRTLVECMGNTREHATQIGPGFQKVPWWAMVHCNESGASFNFVDSGVGIMKSAKISGMARVSRAFRMLGRPEILKRLFLGDSETIGSGTGLPNRGNGLPHMRKDLERGAIAKLTVVTNNVFADVEAGAYSPLGESFRGTLIHWEIRK